MNETHIAIVIPTYNRWPYVREAVESCLKQEVPAGWAFNVIVVDDGSTDGTAQLLTGAISDPRFELHSSPNQERAAARNRGAFYAVKKWRSKWLFFLDSDDAAAPGSFKKFIERLSNGDDEKDCMAIYANSIVWFGEDRFGRERFCSRQPEGGLCEFILTEPSLSLGATFIRADIFQKEGGFCEDLNLSGSEDWEFWCRLSLRGKILYSDHVSYWYRHHPKNTAAERFEHSIQTALGYIEKTLNERIGEKSTVLIQSARGYGDLLIAGTFNAEGGSRKARSYFLKAIRTNPALLLQSKTYRFFLSWIYRTFLKTPKQEASRLCI